MSKIIAVLPAYKAAKTLKPFLKTLPKGVFDEIILVDDCSPDKTYQIAKKQKVIKTYHNLCNLGYGGNLKRCLGIALDLGADVIIEIHPDGEYGTDGIVPALAAVKNGADFVLGNRFDKKVDVLGSGMHLWKYIFIRPLNLLHNLVLGTNIPDLHQGFRVYTRGQLKKINFKSLSNNYIFSFEIIVRTILEKLVVASVPVSTRYSGSKRGAFLYPSLIYGIQTFGVLVKGG